MKLTKRRIEGLEYEPDGPSQQIEWDEKLENFGVRLYESGTKSFIIRYRNEHGRRRYLTIGKFGELTLQQARDLARDQLFEVRKGDDPAAERRRARNAQTVEDLGEAYIEKYAKPRKKSWKKDRNRLDRHVIPAWGTRAPEDVNFHDIDKLHRKLGVAEDKVYEANRTLELIRKMFNWAADAGYVPRDHDNPAARVDAFEEQGRDRRLRKDEVSDLADAIDEESNPYIRNVFWLLLLTGCRRSEMLELEWSNVDLDRNEIHLPDTKSGDSHTLPLPEEAARRLRELPREADNPYVFCGRKDGSHLVNIDRAWNRIRDRSGLDDLRIHDLRRSVASWLAELGHSEYVIKRVLNHAVPDITGVYARVGVDPVRDALEQYVDNLLAAAEDDENNADKVVSMGEAKESG